MELTLALTKQWMKLFAEKIEANKAYLSDLDTPIGDGDHGNNMARGMVAVQEAFKSKNPTDVTSALKLVAMSLISKVGGAAGPLYGTAFLEMAKLSTSTNDLGLLTEAAVNGIKKRGGANAGDKTMVDVWLVAVPALKENSLTAKQIEEAVQSTKDMEAKKGRASYLGERSIGHLDPGSVSSGYLFQALLEAGE
ncbi:dihydroxyacetone kinase subunit DhaL [Ligilactobacillus agilis]|jgi:phosphoenolpyruvate---glycerone phosphotransferase subunit DhaL|uniref:phosphoenolpyruvate--glycerone phosphotransferase n=2 Tax=Ligilactobacillus agilis TaxID=1601 RepID=A0A0R2AK63_9LACO|nr:dihydroxyacetone kinase subunit DhaL [Ligilactobacillus agilis]KRM64441.1 dihydroxyacetone kinase, l subunit [Ligilactobacillus agilis DSM 20509]MDK6810088.1 dihydroxyacetone kinase subunit DhaL [Ligilactobacillus agilis]UNL41702.1 dihydroxyacetone kinase subunit L [Ligilactobacillus agilis]UNL58865.1 dihydroxyacetone kinase subunit L [Ligilactobacillus agilis]GET05970.1 dihydroxyacetone kinase [Ligilactobacillus agilis]